MQLDPDTACARTAAGEAELQVATHGLALGQRRVLTLLESPRSVASLAAEHRLEVVKLDRDLARLAELKLIVLIPQGTATNDVPAAGNATPGEAVVLGRSLRPARIAAVVGGTATLALAVFVFVGARATLEKDVKADTNTRQRANTSIAPPVKNAAAVALSSTPGVIVEEPKGEAQGTVVAETEVRSVRTLTTATPDLRPMPGTPVPQPIITATPNGLGSLNAKVNVAAAGVVATPPVLLPAFVSAQQGNVSPTNVPAAATDPAPGAATDSAAANAPAAFSAPVPAQPIQLAMATPPSPPARATMPTELRALSREPPGFPREAKAAGISNGTVKARLKLDAQGNVTGVEIVQAVPPKIFDRAVRSALSRWTFEPGSGIQSVEIEVAFKSE